MAVEYAKLMTMNPAELAKEESDLREQIWKLRLQVTTGQLQDPHKVRLVRKDLARVLTAQRAQQLKANQAAQTEKKGDQR